MEINNDMDVIDSRIIINRINVLEYDLDNGIIDDDDKLNQRLSGDWLITSINYTFNKRGGFEQEVILVKRELNFNDEDFNPDKAY